jgi:hypothetical protein
MPYLMLRLNNDAALFGSNPNGSYPVSYHNPPSQIHLNRVLENPFLSLRLLPPIYMLKAIFQSSVFSCNSDPCPATLPQDSLSILFLSFTILLKAEPRHGK